MIASYTWSLSLRCTRSMNCAARSASSWRTAATAGGTAASTTIAAMCTAALAPPRRGAIPHAPIRRAASLHHSEANLRSESAGAAQRSRSHRTSAETRSISLCGDLIQMCGGGGGKVVSANERARGGSVHSADTRHATARVTYLPRVTYPAALDPRLEKTGRNSSHDHLPVSSK